MPMNSKNARGIAALALAISACGPPVSLADGGAVDAATDGPGPSARVAVTLEVDPETLEDDTTLERLTLGLVLVRAPNDRGDVSMRVERALDLLASPVEIMLEGATPGVYGEVEVEAGAGAWGAGLDLVVREPTRQIAVRLDESIRIEGRCDTPLELAAGHTLGARLRVDVGGVAQALREADLPPPIEGVIRVDAASAPDLVLEIREHLRRAELDCDDVDETEH